MELFALYGCAVIVFIATLVIVALLFKEGDEGFALFVVCIAVMLAVASVFPSDTTIEEYTQESQTVIYSTTNPTVSPTGKFFLGSGIVDGKVSYILRSKLDQGFVDNLVSGITLRTDVNLTNTALLKEYRKCEVIHRVTPIFFIVDYIVKERTDCKTTHKELYLPPNSIVTEIKV